MVNNNEKILVIFAAMSDLDPSMNEYLDDLKKRYTWSKEAQAEFFSMKRTLHQVSYDLDKIARFEKRKEKKLEDLTIRVRKEAKQLNEFYTENVDKKGERGLEELIDLKQAEFTPEYAENMKNYLKRPLRGINHSRLNYALERRKELQEANIEREIVANKLSRRIRSISSQQMKSLKTVKLSRLKSYLHPLIVEMKRYEINEQVNTLNQKVMNVEDNRFVRPERPSYKKITSILNYLVSQEMRIIRGYTVLDHVIPLYESLNHLRRAIWSKREYVGTYNAYDAFRKQVIELESYYHKSYVQAEGDPKNYHGHYANEYE